MRIYYLLIIGFVILVLIFAIISFIVLEINIQELKNSAQSKNLAISSNLINDFDTFVKKRIDDFKEIGRLKDVQDIINLSNQEFSQLLDVEEFLTGQDKLTQENQLIPFVEGLEKNNLSSELKEIIEFYQNVYEHRVIDELFVTNQYGANIAMGVGTSDYRQDDEKWWQTTKKDGIFIGVPEYNENYNTVSLPLGLRIVNDSGDFLGVLRVSLALDDLLVDLEDDSEILTSENKNVYLIDNNGKIVFSNSQEEFFDDFYDNFNLIQGIQGSFEVSEGGKTDYIAYSTSTGYRDFPGFEWIILIEQDESSFLEDISDVRNEMFITTIIGISSAIIIGVIVSYIISKPLLKLTDIASKLSQGNFEYAPESSRFSEFQTILNSFKKASQTIKQLIATEKDLAETQAKMKNERLTVMGELSSSLAHDLKNPLAVIKTGLDAMKRNSGNLDPQFKEEVFPRMENAVRRMSHQIEDVLNYVRITPTNLQQYSLLDILNSAISNLKIPNNVHVTLPQNDFQIYCDREKIEIVFINLILNSIQAINEKIGNITISVVQQKDYSIIEIQDDGEGLLDENLKLIFKPLFTTKMKGTGLGLTICKNIIEQHGWSIEVKNKPTRFFIKIKTGEN